MSNSVRSRFGLALVFAAIAVLAVPALASATTIRRDSATGAAYSGNVRSTNLTNVTFVTSIRTVTCNQVTMTGSTNSTGSGSVSSASFAYNGGGCQNSDGGTTAITALSLPWTANTAFVGGATDFTLTLSDGSALRVKSVGSFTCVWKASSVPLNGDNSDDKVVASGEAFQEDTAHPDNNDFLCPSSATMNGDFRLRGETTAGSGVYNQRLWVTA